MGMLSASDAILLVGCMRALGVDASIKGNSRFQLVP